MPPKRKRTEADTTTSGPTTRWTTKTSRTTRGKNGAADVTEKGDTSCNSVEPPPKKTRATGKNTNQIRGTKVSGIADVPLNSTSQQLREVIGFKYRLVTFPDELDMPKQAPITVEYTRQQAEVLFKRFADDDDPEVMGPAGVEKLCKEAGISLEGAQPLILAWQFGAQEMAKLSRSEWLQGTEVLRISSLPILATALKELDELVVHNKEGITPVSSLSSVKKRDGVEIYSRTRYWQYASNRNAAFTELYLFCFALSKPSHSRNLDIETTMALWSVLLTPRYPIITVLIEFLTENGSYKGVNKDIWNMVHEFCQTISGDFSNYEADGAWPTMLDDFMAWKRDRMPCSTNVSAPIDN